jgi:hypothetical protein
MDNMIIKIILLLLRPYKFIIFYQKISPMINLLGINIINLTKYLFKLFLDIRFHYYISKKMKMARKACPDPKLGGWLDFFCSCIVYIIVRHIKPETVIETGVGPGGSSAYILKALEDNKKGKLYSIDLPGNDALIYPRIGKNVNIHIPNGFEVGWLIPKWLKHRHELIIGDSSVELPKLLRRLKQVDIFLHDSLHTDEHILMEFNTVFPFVKNNGVLLCDDVNDYWSFAFIHFCKQRGIRYTVLKNRLGIGIVNL